METRGRLDPESAAAAREWYEDLAPAAQTVTRELARAMEFDREEYDQRVTGEVVATARDALFASLLAVQVGTREEFEDWRAQYDGAVEVLGSENVDRVAWHAGPEGEAVAATFQAEPEAAVETLRRQAQGQIYRPLLGD
jgi:cell wall-associated NlpC family hydrolase